jgi:SAM-dependent methyltransferase
MKYDLEPKVAAVLRCPYCRQELRRSSDGSFSCDHDKAVFGWSESGSLDLRPRKPTTAELKFEIAPSHTLAEVPWRADLYANPTPEVNFGDTPLPRHLSRELMSYFPKAAGKDSLMLDLGCGNTVHRQVCEKAGFTYVGMDYNHAEAPILADAHRLPFRDDSFEFLLSIAVLEHIRFPFVMISEAQRVLKPGGVFIGTAAFLEPFHGNSFYHSSRLGILNTLQFGGFEIEQLAASSNYSVFTAQARMSAKILFPMIPGILSSNLILFPYRLSKLWWKLGLLVKPGMAHKRHVDHITGVFSFVAKKPIP